MWPALGLVYLAGFYPLALAWRANRQTTLFQATHWALAAWACWGWALWADMTGATARYLALCLTGCAGVAVLGARRPGVGAWNFVLVGLLAVMLLPLAEARFTGGGLHLQGPRALFLVGTLGTVVLNYLPTRLGWAAVFLGVSCTIELLALTWATGFGSQALVAGRWLLVLTPWVAFERVRDRAPPASEFDRSWLAFRDRYGLVWGQRVREQFNNSAAHAGWPVVLRWRGLHLVAGAAYPNPHTQDAMLTVLRATLKRFGPEEPPV